MRFITVTALLLGATIAQAQTADNVVCDKCINARDIDNAAVATSKLRNGAVTRAKVRNGAINGDKLAPFVKSRVFNPQVRDGAIDTEQLSSTVQSQLAEIDVLKAELAEVTAYVEQLQAYIEVDESTNPNRPVVRVVAANLQVVNGTGQTRHAASSVGNGTGNIIIGYNNAAPAQNVIPDSCSKIAFDDVESCEENNGRWGDNQRTGTHNLIIGDRHSYASSGGIAAGQGNVLNAHGSSATGGLYNITRGQWSVVTGGNDNEASGGSATVTGGQSNTASGDFSSVSGGAENTAPGENDWVAGAPPL